MEGDSSRKFEGGRDEHYQEIVGGNHSKALYRQEKSAPWTEVAGGWHLQSRCRAPVATPFADCPAPRVPSGQFFSRPQPAPGIRRANGTERRIYLTIGTANYRLGEENLTNTSSPASASMLTGTAFAVCLLAFGVNIFWGRSSSPLATSNPR